MWRTLLKPRWLLMLALVVLVTFVFGRLGLWQLSVAHDKGIAEQLAAQAARPEVDLAELVGPHQAFPDGAAGRKVVVTGTYDASRQFLVPDRVLDGQPGWWVLTPLVVEGTGARLAVLRGFLEDPAHLDEPPAEQVTVRGALAPGESPSPPSSTPGVLGSVDLAQLANSWPGELYNAFIFATSEQPPVSTPVLVPVPPPSFVNDDVDWRNFGYALQWWVFAAFAGYMLYRFVREDHLSGQAQAGHPAAQPGQRHTVGS